MISIGYAGDESGGYAGNFLEWGAGARAIAMGKTFSAIANDGTSIYWNPAGLAQLSSRELSAMHSLIFEDRHQNFIAVSFPFNKFSLSAGWMRFGVSNIQERNSIGELTGKFDDSENAFLLGTGYNLISQSTFKLNVGLTAKYFYHALHNYHGTGYGVDIGTLGYFHLPGLVERIGLAVTVQNLGASVKWNTESNHQDDLPIILRLGSALILKPVPFKIALDLEKVERSDFKVHAGAEYWINMLALRVGLNQNKLTAGTGLVFKLINYGVIIDYAFTTDDVANKALHFFMLSFRF
jgi:hypothetical protein